MGGGLDVFVFLFEDAETTSVIAKTSGSLSTLARDDDSTIFVILRRPHPRDVGDSRDDDDRVGDASENDAKNDIATAIGTNNTYCRPRMARYDFLWTMEALIVVWAFFLPLLW